MLVPLVARLAFGVGYPYLTARVLEGSLIIAYALSALLLVVLPAAAGAMALAGEHDRHTMDALLLTPMDHAALVRGRFWQVFEPWARFYIYLMPLYLMLAGSALFSVGAAKQSWGRPDSEVCALGSSPLLSYVLIWYRLNHNYTKFLMDWHWWGVLLALLRFAADLSLPLVSCSGAFFISARASTAGRALLVTYLVIPVAAFLVLFPNDWLAWLAVMDVTDMSNDTSLWLYGLLGLGAVIFRFWLAFWLVRRAARNFDCSALGERPEKSAHA